ncbi:MULTISPECIES: MazG-like family protein [unclassified Streptomyces]|uniref:MazG-like family protein n=1 Tax=unclassified Streptomyces TaxID=2593676 RepID=UPI00226D58F8|nr:MULTISPECIES: MazG-like family protein [unclassified Streptomyces]MCY0922184.1 MazG-like family protein [Streptomyces sp. H27-G5]MCY0957427.1 MazG-like family protein [Streptomyces sp. H27-H5]
MDEVWKTIDELARAFRQRDDERKVPIEQQWTLQVLKIGEEFGEAAQAVIGVHGTNPRKGTSHSWDDVQAEVADTAITALVTLARMRPDDAADFLAGVLADKSSRFLVPAQPSFDKVEEAAEVL